MSLSGWRNAKEIADGALELPVDQRASYIARACEGEPELQAEVERLFAASDDLATGTIYGAPQPGQKEEPSLPDGTLLGGRFRILTHLARGGMGEVYRARDEELREDVALKIIGRRIVDRAGVVEHFRHEVQRARRITHPNVCRIHDLESHQRPDGTLLRFLTMQLIPGPTLRETMRRGERVCPAVAIPLLKDVLAGLDAAHQAGIAHCDLKPNNILVEQAEGEPARAIITDFGLAQAMRSNTDTTVTMTGFVGGSPPYMAPELRFSMGNGVAGDIYAFGAIAYELLTGVHPFGGKPAWDAGPGFRIASPRLLAPEIPPVWEAAILRCLEFDPAARFANVGELRAAIAGGVPVSHVRHWWSKPVARHIVVYATALALAATGYFLWRPAPPAVDSVAVLPFENRTGDPGLTYLTQGVTESLIDDLSRIPTLRVSARGSVMKYEGQKVDTRVAARDLGVRRIIDGAVSKRGNGFLVDAELVDVKTGARVWGDSHQADASSIADVFQQFSTEVTDQLRIKLSGPLKERLRRQYAVGSRSYEQYLKARFHLNKREFEPAIRDFDGVIAADPEYAPAHAGLAATYARMAAFGPFYLGGAEPLFALERARSAAKRALQLDGTLAEAYNALAMVEVRSDYAWGAAEHDYQRSIQLNPSFGETHENYSLELAALGRSDEAIREISLAENLEPDNSHFRAAHGLMLYMMRRYDESLNIYNAIAKTPEGAARVGDFIARNYWMKSMPAEALKVLNSMPKSPSELWTPYMITAYARLGQMDKARELLDKYYLHPEKAWWYNIAITHLNMRQSQDAMRDLEKAYEQRWGDVIWIGVEPLFDDLRSNPQFQNLMRRMNLISRSGDKLL